ncbi:Protein son of sevenless [Schistosoma japonicum]|nr:Protein son of sevenless [Schistosoma japonicum]
MSTSVDQIFHTGLLDLSCHRLLEVHCLKLRKAPVYLSPVARTFIVSYTLDIVKSLLDSTVPRCISDVIERIDYCFPEKLKPAPQFLNEVQSHIEKSKRKTLYISSDKVFSCLKTGFPRMESPVSLFLTYLMEHIIGQIVQWAVHYESKIQSGYIDGTDVQHIFSLFGAPKLSKSHVCYPLQLIPRKSADYKDYAKEIQYLLRSSVQHLGIVVRVFRDSLMKDLSQIRIITESFLTEYSDTHIINMTARRLLDASKSAQLVFDRASEVYSHVTALSECIDDAFEDHTRLLGSCLIEPAEDETFYNFAHYADALFSSDCREWINILGQTPSIMRTLANEFHKILHVTLSNASSRRQTEIKLRFSDPHACNLCSTSCSYYPINLISSGSSDYFCADSSQSYWWNMLSGHTSYSGTDTNVTCTISSVEHVTTTPTPPYSILTNNKLNHSPSSTSFTNAQLPKQTDDFLHSNVKHSSDKRSINSPLSSLQLFHKSISEPTNHDIIYGQVEKLASLSTSSSAVVGNNVKTTHSNQFNLSEKVTLNEIDNCSSGPGSFKDNQAHLTEHFNCCSDFTTFLPTCNHIVIAFRYLLPRLLLLPNLQLLHLADHIEALHAYTTDENEQATLKDVMSMLSKTRSSVSSILFNQDWVKSIGPKLAFFMKTPFYPNLYPTEGKSTLEELISSVRRTQHFSEVPLVMSEFLMDGQVQIRIDHGRPKKSERIAYLFNNWLLLCKKQKRVLSNVMPTSSYNSNNVLKVKKRICLEHFHIIDLASEFNDNNDVLFLFDLECWEAPKLPSILLNSQTSTTSSHANTLSSYNSVIHAETQSTPYGSLNRCQFQHGSVLSVSTLTSNNTLVDHSIKLNARNDVNDKSLILPTAGDAAEASNSALIDTISSYPKQRFTFIFSNKEDKANWISALVYLRLARLFKRYLSSLPRQDLPLILPSPSVYRYAVPDSPSNIILESPKTDDSIGIPIIRAATILKLIERTTYHEYFDNKTLSAFLLTYRRYITSLELLDLLIERFNIPNPDFTEAASEAINSVRELDGSFTAAVRLEQRFRSIYKRRVQYRVLNFIIKWVKNSSYYKLDILPNAVLRSKLWSFLDTVNARNLSDNVTNIRKSLLGDRIRLVQTIQQLPPDQLDLGLVAFPNEVKLTTVHPLELARQVTLYEWELYSHIEFWEVTGKERIKSPNFEISLQFSNKFKWWLVSSIMSAEHLEDRMIIMQRVADLLVYFDGLNNLQGVQEAKAALLSSPVFRLSETYDTLIAKSRCHYRNFFESLRQFVEYDIRNVYFTDYQEKLHQIHPPGLPFIAVEDKTQLIHLELKYPDWISTSELPLPSGPDSQSSNSGFLINFWKCRQLADLVEYYLSFQQTPYNFSINKPIRRFLETLNPLNTWGVDSENLFDDIMYEKSLKIQPKQSDGFFSVSHERHLKPVEVKIAAALNLTQPDLKLTADSREFRSLLQIISTVINSSSSVASTSECLSAKEVCKPVSAPEQINDILNEGMYASASGASRLQSPHDSSLFVPDTNKHPNHLNSCVMDVYAASSSPEIFPHIDSSQFISPNISSINVHKKCENADTNCSSSPPPLPPRTIRSINQDKYSKHSNQVPNFQGSFHSICNPKLTHIRGVEEKSSWSNVVTKSSICGDCNSIVTNLIDNVSKPPTLPPRIHYSELYSARPFRDSSTIQSSNMVSESLCMDSWLTNLSRVSSHDLTNVNRSSPPPLPPKKVVTPSI